MKNVLKVALLFLALFSLSGCCFLREGAWRPLPSCKNADEFQQMKAAKEQSTGSVNGVELPSVEQK